MKVKVACVQMRSTPDRKSNLEKMERLFLEAVRKGARFVAFPENCTILTDDIGKFNAAIETIDGPTVKRFQKWASNQKTWLLIGSMPLKRRGSRLASNSSVLIDSAGKVVGRYDKIHLFDVNLSADRRYAESEKIAPGSKPVSVSSPWGVIGLSICYDLRFPELYRAYADLGANIITIPAAFSAVTGKAHWDVLTRARAVENQCFVLCPAQTGNPHPGRKTYGHTRIVDPWGTVLAEKKSGEGIVTAILSYREMARVRQELPALKHRRIGFSRGNK